MNPPTVGGKFAAKDVGGGVPDVPGGVKTPPYDAKDKGDAKRNRELTQGCGPGMPGPYGLLFPAAGVRGNSRISKRRKARRR